MCNRFNRRGINRKGSTYICECCGKRTRETGNEESTRSLCLACDLAGEIEITMSDHGSKFSQEQINGITAAMEAAKYDTPDADVKAIRAIHNQVCEIAFA